MPRIGNVTRRRMIRSGVLQNDCTAVIVSYLGTFVSCDIHVQCSCEGLSTGELYIVELGAILPGIRRSLNSDHIE